MLSPAILAELRDVVGADGLIIERNQLQTYECDALAVLRSLPGAVILPRSTAQLQKAVAICARHHIPFVGRGAGTGLSGGAMPDDRGIVISFARMTKFLATDIPNQRITVEAGVINAHVTQRFAPTGYFYAPDPSSQTVCTIGGNVAENSGGAHCLKYGFTTTHVLGLEVVLPDGSIVQLGSRVVDSPGYDLPGIFVGSEGTLGIATKIILRIVKKPSVIQTLLAAFNSTEEAGAAGGALFGAGMLRAA